MNTIVSSRMWTWLPFIFTETFLYLSYQQNDGRFHWFLHFFVGASTALIVMGLSMVLSGHIVRHPLFWIIVGHVIAMFPDILWNFQVATHQPWMDVFLAHIAAHFIPGRNWTWYAIFLASLAFYLYQRAVKEGDSPHCPRPREQMPGSRSPWPLNVASQV